MTTNSTRTSPEAVERRPIWQRARAALALNEPTQMVILGAIVGAAVGMGAVGFIYLYRLLEWSFFGGPFNIEFDRDLLDILQHAPPWRVLIAPVAGLLLIYPIVSRISIESKGHGVPEVMEAVALRGGRIRRRVVLSKIVSSAVTLGSGGSVGREGPIVQIGAAMGSSIGRALGLNPRRMRTLVGCGAAGGIAAVFNAPIAGAIFALEIILGNFGLAQTAPIFISSVAATAVSHFFLGKAPSFAVPHYELLSGFELPLYVVLGLAAGLLAVFFTRILYFCEDIVERARVPRWSIPVVGGLIIGSLGLVGLPHLLGGGYESISMALENKLHWNTLILLVFIKMVATSVTLSAGGSGGVFAPSLYIGAMAGGLFGICVNALFPSVTADPGAYALVGMGAVVAGATRAPITAIIILFEMTDNYTIILPMMITCIISTLVARGIDRHSIYTHKLARRGVELTLGQEAHILRSIQVSEAMTRDVVTVSEGMPFRQIIRYIPTTRHTVFPVVDEEGNLTGTISFQDFREVVFDRELDDLVIAKEIASRRLVTVTSHDSLLTALERFSEVDAEEIPVTDPGRPKRVIGMLTRSDILTAYNRWLHRI